MRSDEMQEVLARAHEIESQSGALLHSETDVESFVAAAEETGLSRDAVLQALRERLRLPAEAYEPGKQVFAASADGHHYVANLLSISDRTAKVEFLNGGTHTLPVHELRAFSTIPGQKVQYFSPSSGMWFTGTIVKYNEAKKTIKVSAWGSEESVSLAKVRLAREGTASGKISKIAVWAYAALSYVGGAGTVLLILKLLGKL